MAQNSDIGILVVLLQNIILRLIDLHIVTYLVETFDKPIRFNTGASNSFLPEGEQVLPTL